MADAEPKTEVDMAGEEKDAVYTPGPNAIDVSPNQDKGVLKEIIKEGRGTDSPQTGNKVHVHYTGKLLDGTVFDSSRDRGDVFEFTLGRGHVIKAWDIGVATMKEGELAMLTCHSDYAYGKAGSPPKIPADATLVFEVELISWDLEDLTYKKDGGIRRLVIKEGEGTDTPNDEATVEAHLIGKYAGNVFEERVVKFQLGEGHEHAIVEGLEVALKNLKKGETSKIILSPLYAFGSSGRPDFNIPPDSEVEYEVTLKSFEKAKESWEMEGEEKVEQSEIVKSKGTKYFKNGDYEKAIKQYKKIVSYLQHETGLEADKGKQRDALLLAGYLNLAACYLKTNEPQNAIENCDKALEMEATNVKGLFRRGQANLILKDYDVAKSDFQKVLDSDPSNKAAQKQVLVCKENIKQQIAKEKQLYKNMFEKLAKYSDDDEGKGDGKKSPDKDMSNEADSTTPEKIEIDGEQGEAEAAKA